MRSRAEWALRAAVLAALALLLWDALRPSDDRADVAASQATLDRTLVHATRNAVSGMSVELDSTASPVQREWLAAIRAAGTELAWSGDLTPLAIATSPVPEPEGRVRVVVAAKDSARVVLSDGLGAIDTLAVRAGGSSRLLRTATGYVSASSADSRGTAALPQAAKVRRVLVLGSAGWETKFVIAALEEDGWSVDARIRV